MKDSEASVTANYVTVFRSRAQNDPRFKGKYSDPYAHLFINEDGKKRVADVDVNGYIYKSVIGRTAYIDQILEEFVRRHKGKKIQLVVLGAGYDSRSAKYYNDFHYSFEVDHPASSRAKVEAVKNVVARDNTYKIDKTQYIKCDFMNRESNISELLIGGGKFDQSAATFYILEGVTMYLDAAAVERIFNSISSTNANSWLIFDIFTHPVKSVHKNEDFIFNARSILPLASKYFKFCHQESLSDSYFNLFGEYIMFSAAAMCICKVQGDELRARNSLV